MKFKLETECTPEEMADFIRHLSTIPATTVNNHISSTNDIIRNGFNWPLSDLWPTVKEDKED